jgi:hypothetical protein
MAVNVNKTLQQIEVAALLSAVNRYLDLRILWRLLGWGGAAAVALASVVLVSHTQIGAERLQLALAREPEPQAIAAVPPRVVVDAEETRRLADAVRKLTADRDRLNTRLASLEHNLDDMTGSIKTVMLANAAAQSVKEPPKDKKDKVAEAPPPPAIESPASIPTPVVSPAAPVTSGVSGPIAPPTAANEAAPADNVPLPPVRMAGVPADEPAIAPPPAKLEYGIDLGGRSTLDGLREHWLTVKANHGPLLVGLHPVAAQRLRQSGTDYRLLLGPLPTVAAATKLCVKFNAVHAACHTARFFGEVLAQQ